MKINFEKKFGGAQTTEEDEKRSDRMTSEVEGGIEKQPEKYGERGASEKLSEQEAILYQTYATDKDGRVFDEQAKPEAYQEPKPY